MTRSLRLLTLACCAASLGACRTAQSVLGGDGAQGRQFVSLFTIFMVVTALVYLLVLGFLGAAVLRHRHRQPDDHIAEKQSHHESSPLLRPLLIGWGALIAVGLAGLTLASFFADRSEASTRSPKPLEITVTGHQWWWDVEYASSEASQTLRTANELHLPVGVPALIHLRSSDVIHSFWVPNLAGKQDLIPGRQTDIALLPRHVGVFRGQCAEFCGMQHAHMAFDVTVESKADYLKWRAASLAPAAPPRTPLAMAGLRYVTTRECSMCHAIGGTAAYGRVGPDLTHVASRRSIAAGTLPMSRAGLYAWVADPQSQKPGSHMPTVGIEPNELHAVVAYLEGLK